MGLSSWQHSFEQLLLAPPPTSTSTSMARNKEKRNGRSQEPQEFNLLMWSHPPVSGLVLAAGLVLLVSLLRFSLISVVAHAALAVLLLAVAARVYVHLMGFLKKPCTDPLDSVRDIEVTLPAEQVEAFVTSSAERLNTVATSLKSLILVEDYVESIKFGALMYVLSFIGAMFNALSLLILAWVGAFIFPTVYDQNQEKFDDVAAQLTEKYRAVNDKINSMVPAAKKVEAAAPSAQEKEES